MVATKKIEISAAELELKRRGRRRLIGAVTLGILAVVILPMIFDSAPKKIGDAKNAVKQEIAIDIPLKEGLAPLPAPTAPAAPVATTAAVAPTAPIAVPTPTPAPVMSPPPVATVAEKAPPAKVVVTEPKPAPAPAPAPVLAPVPTKESPKAAPAKAGSFVVQIGAYKDQDNAKAIITQMKDAKLSVFSDTISVKTGKVTRVRLGPFATKEKAEAALLQAKLAGVTGKVVPQ
jgi:DedD protein